MAFTLLMIKPLLAILLLASFGALPTDAKTLPLPDAESAIASITIPDSWEPGEIENGVVGTSPDKAVYLAVVGVESEKGMSKEIEDTFAMLKEHKVELDQDSKKENKFKVNGLDAEEMVFAGKDEDGPASVSITFMPIKDKVLVLTYWVTSAQEAKHSEEVGKILKSIKPKG